MASGLSHRPLARRRSVLSPARGLGTARHVELHEAVGVGVERRPVGFAQAVLLRLDAAIAIGIRVGKRALGLRIAEAQLAQAAGLARELIQRERAVVIEVERGKADALQLRAAEACILIGIEGVRIRPVEQTRKIAVGSHALLAGGDGAARHACAAPRSGGACGFEELGQGLSLRVAGRVALR